MISDRGYAGASAHRESVRHGASREASQWRAGAVGESVVGRLLAEGGVRAIHDRRIPGSDANIDHLAVTAAGVLVIDAKNYSGRPRVETFGGADPRPRRLFVGSEDRTPLVFTVRRYVHIVEGVLFGDPVPVRGVLCFVGAEWDVITGYLVGGVGVTSCDGLSALVRMPGSLSEERQRDIHRRLSSALEPA